jgi:hypothetical protein
MKSKRLYAIIIAGTVTLSSAPTIFAQELPASQPVYSNQSSEMPTKIVSSEDEQKAKINKDTAKDLAKKVLKDHFETELDESKYQISIYLRQNYDFGQTGYLWDINWNQNSSLKTINIGVSVDATTGKILRVNKNEYSNGQPTIASITEDSAKVLSDEFLKKINPDEFKQVQLLPNFNSRLYYYSPVNYSFNYVRMVNDVKFDGNMITVDVNGTTGKIMGYSCRWTDNLNLPGVDGVVGSAKAEEAFRKQVKLNLSYVSYMDKYSTSQSERSVKLIYTPELSQAQLLNAKDGKFLDYNGSTAPAAITKDLSSDERESFYRSLKPLQVLNKEIDRDRASELATNALRELYGTTYEIESLNYSEDENNYGTGARKLWSASFRKTDSKDARISEGGQIVIDALTEGVVNLYKYNSWPNDSTAVTPNYTWEQMYSKAIAALAKYYPDKAKEVKTSLTYINPQNQPVEKYYPGMSMNYHFERTVNGIPYRDNSIDVSFSPITGELTELRCYWDNKITFPEPKNTLVGGEEIRIFFTANKPELAYTVVNKSTDYSKPQYETILVYRLYNSVAGYPGASIDAFSGKFLDYDMQEIDDNIEKFKAKIKGLPIEKELTILAAQGVVDTKTFEVNSQVTKIELIKMLVNARGYRPGILMDAAKLNFKSEAAAGDINYKYLQMAVYYGIIENQEGEIKLNDAVSREEMAKTLVKLLGYDKLAQAKGIFVLTSADSKEISTENTGYIAIAKGMGILAEADSKLRPKAVATMGELSLGIYQVLGNLRTGY